MSTTFLLLRNNKQTGPHSLEALLQQDLRPTDLIWMEGQSAGWSYPSEISVLKPYLTDQNRSQTENAKPATAQAPTASIKTERNNHLHIYVSLPADRTRTVVDETPATPSLEQKAEALYQRVQAFSHGQNAEEADTRYSRSLDDMKQEYSTWLVQQRKKKKQGSLKKKVLIAASVLVVTTTGFGVTKWISHKAGLKESPLATYALSTVSQAEKKQPEVAALNMGANSFTTTTTLPKDTTLNTAITQKNTSKSIAKKNSMPKLKISLPVDTAKGTTLPMPVQDNTTAQKEVKKVVPLSQSVVVTGNVSTDKKDATKVTLQNNSSETLKSVAVLITYFKKEDRPLNKETIYFYNVQPGSAPVLNASGNRRATSAHFEIGTIVRADGSLYLIH